MTSTHAQSVAILGGGPAGLTAAYRLARLGYRVTIVDRRPLPESRLSEEHRIDNPEPFTVLGCHRATITLLQSLHPNRRQPALTDIHLEFCLDDRSTIRYPQTKLPAPFHAWISLLKFSGLPWKERWRLASWLERLWECDERLPADLEQRTADEWLTSIGQTTQARRAVWNPLARWLTGNDLSVMSADAFVAAIRPPFLRTTSDNRISIARDSLQASFVQPIVDALAEAGATILPNTEATALRYERDHISGIQLQHGPLLQADWYVAALPQQQLAALLPERWLTHYAYFQQLAELRSIDRTVLHLQAEQPCVSPRLVLLRDMVVHSVLAAATTPNHTGFALVAAGNTQPDSDLDRRIPDLLRTLGLLRPGCLITSTRRRTIPNAILSLKPGTKLHRPIQRSPIANLLVAGAWTDTGWPPGLESAIVSGNHCADAIALR